MVTVEALKQKIQALIDKANSTTSKSDVDLNSGVNSLIEGFGRGEATPFTDILRLPGTVIHYGYGRSSALTARPGCIVVDFDLNEVAGDYTKQQSFILRWINAQFDGDYGNVYTSSDKATWHAKLYAPTATGMFIDNDSFYTANIPNSGSSNRRYVSLTLRLTIGSEVNESNVHGCILTLNEKIGNRGLV